MTLKPWTLSQMEEAIDQDTHVSALQPVATKILVEEVAAKENKVQFKVILWDTIKENQPEDLNPPLISMIPHNYRLFEQFWTFLLR